MVGCAVRRLEIDRHAEEHGLRGLRYADVCALRSLAPRRYETVGEYVRACYRLARMSSQLTDVEASQVCALDFRVVAVGFCRVPPRRWVEEGALLRFADYWNRATLRSETVGSPYNTVDPFTAYTAMLAGIPASALLMNESAFIMIFRCRDGRVALWRHPSRRTIREFVDASRCYRRASARAPEGGGPVYISIGAAKLLGRMPAWAQRAAIVAFTSTGAPSRSEELTRSRIDWEAVRRARSDKEAWVRTPHCARRMTSEEIEAFAGKVGVEVPQDGDAAEAYLYALDLRRGGVPDMLLS
jgi:hypothetical protein